MYNLIVLSRNNAMNAKSKFDESRNNHGESVKAKQPGVYVGAYFDFFLKYGPYLER